MAERLLIENFAGLNLDIELGRINLLIGPQASGKSICAKCLYFFKNFTERLVRYATESSQPLTGFAASISTEFLELFDFTETSQPVRFKYSLGNYFVEIGGLGAALEVTYSTNYHHLLRQARKTARNAEGEKLPELDFTFDLYRRLTQQAAKEQQQALYQRYIPASRALFALTGGIGTGRARQPFSDRLLDEFSNLYPSIRRRVTTFRTGQPAPIAELVRRILRARFYVDEEEGHLVQDNGTRTKLAYASSGQQEALPLVLMLEYLAYFTTQLPDAWAAYIEEPEAHLHPEAQRDVVNLLAAVYNLRPQALQFFITTHSPYLLACFNNLLYAKQIADKLKPRDSKNRKKLAAIVPKEQQLDVADFRAYKLEDGKAVSIISEDDHLLEVGLLDEVSQTIAREFDALMQTEYGE